MCNECINIAPGDDKQRKSVVIEKYCEKRSSPHLFSKRKFGYRVIRYIN